MALLAGAILGSSAISAGAALGGAAMAPDQNPDELQYFASQGFPMANPSAALQALFELSSLGLVDETTLQQASPINRALSLLYQQPMSSLMRGRLINFVGDYRRALASGETSEQYFERQHHRGNIYWQMLSSTLGMTPEDLVASEGRYQAQVGPLTQMAQQSAEGNLARRLAASRQLAQLTEGVVGTDRLPGLEARIRESLTTDINRIAGEQQGDLLRTANAANFNPGRALGELERGRFQALENVDVDALTRATQILSQANAATASQADLLQRLIGSPNPSLLGVATASSPMVAQAQADTSRQLMGQGIQTAGNTISSALTSLGYLSKLGLLGKPATPGQLPEVVGT